MAIPSKTNPTIKVTLCCLMDPTRSTESTIKSRAKIPVKVLENPTPIPAISACWKDRKMLWSQSIISGHYVLLTLLRALTSKTNTGMSKMLSKTMLVTLKIFSASMLSMQQAYWRISVAILSYWRISVAILSSWRSGQNWLLNLITWFPMKIFSTPFNFSDKQEGSIYSSGLEKSGGV